MGQFLMIAGFFVVILGVIIHFDIQIPWLVGWIGKLPGDLVIRKQGVTIYFPLTTSLVASFIFSLLFSIFKK